MSKQKVFEVCARNRFVPLAAKILEDLLWVELLGFKESLFLAF
jgi:hypothetical protein